MRKLIHFFGLFYVFYVRYSLLVWYYILGKAGLPMAGEFLVEGRFSLATRILYLVHLRQKIKIRNVKVFAPRLMINE